MVAGDGMDWNKSVLIRMVCHHGMYGWMGLWIISRKICTYVYEYSTVLL